MRRNIVGVLLGWMTVLAQGCGTTPATPLMHVSPQRSNPTWREAFHTPDYSMLDKQQVATYRALHEEVDQLVHSPEFVAALRDLEAVAAAPSQELLSGTRLAARYLHEDPGVESLAICYRFLAGGRTETAKTNVVPNRKGCGAGKAGAADITLREATFQRARSEKLEEHACAVNTLAHEWMHAVTTPSGQVESGHLQLYNDGDHSNQPDPIASYVVGAVAQCTYLANAKGGFDHFNVSACIEAAGTNTFFEAPCTVDWSKQFVTK